MTHPFALQGLLDIANTEEGSAAAALGHLNQELQSHEQKLALLLQYRADYQERLRAATVGGTDAVELRNFNDFISRLEQAITQQRATLGEARRHAEQGREHWQNKRRKSKAYDTLSQRAGAATLRLEGIREQKLQDDFASRRPRVKPCA